MYTSFLGGMPVGFTTNTYTSPSVSEFDPSLLSGFASIETYNRSTFSNIGDYYYYDYSLGGYNWRIAFQTDSFTLGNKVFFFGLWLGAMEYETFSFQSEDRGTQLSFTELETDNTTGQVRYALAPIGGGLLFAWDVETYANPSDAWDNNDLQLLHGIGANSESPTNMLGLLLGLMFFSVPDIPTMLQVLIAAPIYASVIYLSWFVIKEVIPFV
jgi:hypothetical protein